MTTSKKHHLCASVDLSFKRGVKAFCAATGMSISDFFIAAAAEYIEKRADEHNNISALLQQKTVCQQAEEE
jgi:hypothetical protein